MKKHAGKPIRLGQDNGFSTLLTDILTAKTFPLRDTPSPVERDRLVSIGGSLTMFPQEPHSYVGGCTNNLTQTTQVQTCCALPVARVLGYYYVCLLRSDMVLYPLSYPYGDSS